MGALVTTQTMAGARPWTTCGPTRSCTRALLPRCIAASSSLPPTPAMELAKASTCGQIPQNSMTWAFPWYGPYLNGIYICDFVAVPSGQGGFGVYARRQLAIDAFWQ